MTTPNNDHFSDEQITQFAMQDPALPAEVVAELSVLEESDKLIRGRINLARDLTKSTAIDRMKGGKYNIKPGDPRPEDEYDRLIGDERNKNAA